MITTISTDKAPLAIGPYSQAVCADNFVFLSGQIPLSPETNDIVGETVGEQTAQVLKNAKAVLAAADCSFADVVKTSCFLADMTTFSEFNAVYDEYFPNKPARECYSVKALPKNVLVEVSMIAVRKH